MYIDFILKYILLTIAMYLGVQCAFVHKVCTFRTKILSFKLMCKFECTSLCKILKSVKPKVYSNYELKC